MWNAPTWFLSALTFATVCLPFALPAIARWRKKGLKTAMLVLTAVSVIAKVAYSYDTNGWFFMEGKFFVILVQAIDYVVFCFQGLCRPGRIRAGCSGTPFASARSWRSWKC